ncbi:hypothetical protein BZA05DRAFT_341218 [Tricharina praecox]|uniref:uncharacterized protein n=1 Tax=Tricharina praecox TaxID=43433 RepID=UPI0022211A67|nr:uncharacterized protein BZA05DRAFT_341218 [Tricharina praecox]KAI5846921.1 hypothetical protein BZA05DRAFT_341218 [Tricharina praecox]
MQYQQAPGKPILQQSPPVQTRAPPPQQQQHGYAAHPSPPQHAPISKQPSPAPVPAVAAKQIPPGGAPARKFLNENVTPALLEGMTMLAREQPKEPLLALARFLEEKHKELASNDDKDVKMEDANGSA